MSELTTLPEPKGDLPKGNLYSLLEHEARCLRRARRAFRWILIAYTAGMAVLLLVRLPAQFAPVTPQTSARAFRSGRVPETSIPQVVHADVHEGTAPAATSATPPTAVEIVHADLRSDRRSGMLVLEPGAVATVYNVAWGLMIGLLAASLAVIVTLLRLMANQKRAAEILARIDDVRAVPPLVEALPSDDGHIRRLTQAALVRLLPQMRATDSALLSEGHHAILNRELMGRNGELVIAILRAYEQVGDSIDLLPVERLARRLTFAPRGSAVRDAVESCLQYLRARARNESISHRLLHPADVPGPAEALLRPAGCGEANPRLLLRAPGGPVCSLPPMPASSIRRFPPGPVGWRTALAFTAIAVVGMFAASTCRVEEAMVPAPRTAVPQRYNGPVLQDVRLIPRPPSDVFTIHVPLHR